MARTRQTAHKSTGGKASRGIQVCPGVTKYPPAGSGGKRRGRKRSRKGGKAVGGSPVPPNKSPRTAAGAAARYRSESEGETPPIRSPLLPKKPVTTVKVKKKRKMYHGVYAKGSKWAAKIHHSGSLHLLGSFPTAHAAALARDLEAVLHPSNKRILNFATLYK